MVSSYTQWWWCWFWTARSIWHIHSIHFWVFFENCTASLFDWFPAGCLSGMRPWIAAEFLLRLRGHMFATWGNNMQQVYHNICVYCIPQKYPLNGYYILALPGRFSRSLYSHCWNLNASNLQQGVCTEISIIPPFLVVTAHKFQYIAFMSETSIHPHIFFVCK